MIQLIECPRDAMQGIHEFIPTEKKIAYINQLLKVGFSTIDFGSFVSPKAIPQMKDTSQLLKHLNLEGSSTKLLAIVANLRGATDACSFDEISFLGFPYSISEEFQKRNTNSSLEESLARIEEIYNLAVNNGKELVVYLSMAFGNPYGEKWHPDLALKWIEKLIMNFGISNIALSDTIGVSNPENISFMFKEVLKEFKTVKFGAHLHTTPETWKEKVKAAINSGCTSFDGALKGFGGCPMAKDELTGNMPTEKIISYIKQENFDHKINNDQLLSALRKASEIFSSYH